MTLNSKESIKINSKAIGVILKLIVYFYIAKSLEVKPHLGYDFSYGWYAMLY